MQPPMACLPGDPADFRGDVRMITPRPAAIEFCQHPEAMARQAARAVGVKPVRCFMLIPRV